VNFYVSATKSVHDVNAEGWHGKLAAS